MSMIVVSKMLLGKLSLLRHNVSSSIYLAHHVDRPSLVPYDVTKHTAYQLHARSNEACLCCALKLVYTVRCADHGISRELRRLIINGLYFACKLLQRLQLPSTSSGGKPDGMISNFRNFRRAEWRGGGGVPTR